MRPEQINILNNQNQHWKVQSYRNASPIRKSQMLYDLRKKVFSRSGSNLNLKGSDLEKLYFLIVNTPIKSLEDVLSLGMEAQWLSGLGIDEKTLMKLVDAVWQNSGVNPRLTPIQKRHRISEIFNPILK